MVWFTQEEDIRLHSFVANDLKTEIALNSVCAEIVNMVLEDDNLRSKLVGRIDGKVKQSWDYLTCKWCARSLKNEKVAQAHYIICPKRPLEVLAR